jgi:tetratricopeptide (TPR) repeat protein
LTNLSKVTRDTANQVKILTALGALYRELGLMDEATDAFKAVAGLADDPAILADAAIVLFESNDVGTALTIARRIDAATLPSERAYTYRAGLGKLLLRINPRQGLDQLEQAYRAYPAFRTAPDAELLLTAYLNLDQTAKARAIVMDLATRAREHPQDGPRLQAAAVRWADHLFAKGDYRGAAEAYTLAVTGNGEASDDEAWARFQQANALLNVQDFITSLPLFEDVARSGVDWSEDARLKADYARLERRLRGIDEPRPPSAAGVGG